MNLCLYGQNNVEEIESKFPWINSVVDCSAPTIVTEYDLNAFSFVNVQIDKSKFEK